MSVVIETSIGDIIVDLFIKQRPKACLNFLKLCKLKYYNFNLFHNIERNFIAQTGDPTGAGDGGDSIWGIIEGPHKRFFEAENLPKIKHEIPGLLSLVSVGKNMVSSQFFFTLGQDLISLDNIHCVIGEVAEGHDILRKLNEAIVDEKFRPYQDIRITHTVILEDPFNDPRGFRMPSRSPSPSPEKLKNGRIGADENIDDTQGKTMEEIQEMLAEREAKARATILEIVGDLPDAEIAPPENVLFVCKLNPVTTEDDLEIIFSRFGKVIGCEVIKDKISGDSLQYAFVEFEDKKSCEAAYFKMDNVLIDDRRIHVDFSQSVSKVQWKGKGKGLIYKGEKEDRKLDFNNYKETMKREENKSRYKRREHSDRNKNRNFRRRSGSYSPERNYSRNRDHHEKNTNNRDYKQISSPRYRSRSPHRKSQYSRYYDKQCDRDDYRKEKHFKNKTNRHGSRSVSPSKQRRHKYENRSISKNRRHDYKDSNMSKNHENNLTNQKEKIKKSNEIKKYKKADKRSKNKRQFSETESSDSSSSSLS